MGLVKYNLLGRTGLSVSAISLGTVELGMDYGLPGSSQRPTVALAERLIHHALDAGINHLDTARAYGDSETIIGKALGTRRGQVVLTTKVTLGDLPTMIASVETSLRHLRTGCVDILMLHSAFEPDAIDHLLAIQARGYCRYLGASVYGPEAAIQAIGCGVFDCLQIAYSPLDRRPEIDLFRQARQANIGLVARSVLLKGALTPRYRTLPPGFAELQAAVARLDLLGLPLTELAYRYVLAQPAIATALAGTAHLAELDELLTYSGHLPVDVQQRLRQEPLLPERWLNPGLWPSG